MKNYSTLGLNTTHLRIMIRVGRSKWEHGKRIDPSYPGFTPILCLTKSSPYGELSPYMLKGTSR